ncbi:hypothetical protein C8Q74DRAFT_314053 [Fomes fomentarius]|nr:hypothetical protein C8Q74DRAFT_314053 [Fomes fomentarius]
MSCFLVLLYRPRFHTLSDTHSTVSDSPPSGECPPAPAASKPALTTNASDTTTVALCSVYQTPALAWSYCGSSTLLSLRFDQRLISMVQHQRNLSKTVPCEKSLS